MNSISIPTDIPVNVQKTPFEQVAQFSKRDVAYVNADPALRPFYKYPTTLEAFQQVIADKSKQAINRSLLVEVLKKQYQVFSPSKEVSAQIAALEKDNTYTVLTAHQPTLFTGPLYYVYKIISTITLAENLRKTYPSYHFVPVFVTGGEDHDFDEMNHVRLFNKQIQWQNEESGSVGMMQTASLKPVLAEIKEILGQSEKAKEIYDLLEKTHTEHATYGNATMAFAHELFKSEGLLILNMNQADLKRAFIPVLKQELTQQVSHPFIQATQTALGEAGFKSQAFPREINLFYLTDQVRERIVFEDKSYKVLNTKLEFSEAELLAELDAHPERFSPNVNMRPLYQEYILPNLAYIGGGGELAYWMERQSQFAHFGINFPMLIRRNSVLWIDKGSKKRMHKFNLSLQDLLQEEHQIIKSFVARQSDATLNLDAQKAQLSNLFEEIATIAATVDPSLKKSVLAEQTKQLKVINQLEGRISRTEKQKHETALKQISGLKEKFFPNNGLQERTDNFIPFFLKHGWAYFQVLKQHLNPLEKGMVVIEEV